MAYTTPKTWNVGELLTSSDMNKYVRDNVSYLKPFTDRMKALYYVTNTNTTSTTSGTAVSVHADYTQNIAMTGGRMMVGFTAELTKTNATQTVVALRIAGIQSTRTFFMPASLLGGVVSPVWVDQVIQTGTTAIDLQFYSTVAGQTSGITVRQFWVTELFA